GPPPPSPPTAWGASTARSSGQTTRPRTGRSPAARIRPVLAGADDLLDGPAVAVGVGEEDEAAPGGVLDLAALDAAVEERGALRQLKPRRALLVYGHLPPVRIRLRPWF